MRASCFGRAAVVAGTSAVALTLSLVGFAPVALAAPQAVASVQVMGDAATPLAVSVTWTIPSDPSYVGARVVVVPGGPATSDPSDPAAVNRQDAPAGTATARIGSLSPGQQYTATVFAYDSSSAFSSGVSVSWAEPGAAPEFTATGTDHGGGLLQLQRAPTGSWSDQFVVCTARDAAPVLTASVPALCYLTSFDGRYQPTTTSVPAVVGHTYGISLFSYSPALHALGPPKSVSDVAVRDTAPDAPWPGATGSDAHSVTFLIDNDPNPFAVGLTDLQSVVVLRATGTRPPAATARPVAVIPITPAQATVTYKATALATNQAYTFNFRLRDLAGHTSPPSLRSVTVAAHVAGTFIATNNTATGRWRLQRSPVPRGYGAARFGITTSGQQHLVYTNWETAQIFYASRSATGRWSSPRTLGATSQSPPPPQIDVSTDGHVVVGWDGLSGPLFRTKQAGHSWSSARRIPTTAGTDAQLLALVQDPKHGIHAIVNEGSWDAAGVTYTERSVYVTNVTGRWTRSSLESVAMRAPGGDGPVIRLAADPMNGTIVVLLVDPGLVRIARAARTSTAFGTPSTVLRGGTYWYPDLCGSYCVAGYSIGSYGGRIAATVQVAAPRSAVVVLTGTSPTKMSTLALPGARTSDAAAQVTVTSRARLVLAWTRASATWTPSQQGVFTATLTRDAARIWRFSRPQQLSNTHYDNNTLGVSTDGRGHLYVGFSRSDQFY